MAPANCGTMHLLVAFSLLGIARAADLPAGRCTDLSLRSPSWQISDLKLGASDSRKTLSFLLQSNVTGYTARCSNQDGRSTCQSTTVRGSSDDVKTWFQSWIEPDNSTMLHLDQTWNCGDAGPNRNIKFNAVANVTISRTCSVTTTGPNVMCQKPGAASVFGSLLSPVKIDYSPPSQPLHKDTPGCLAASSNNSWTISNFYYRGAYTGIISFGSQPFHTGHMSFNLTNAATKHTVVCSTDDPELGYVVFDDTSIPPKWIDCAPTPPDPSRERPEYKMVTKVLFNGKQLSVDQVWFCDGTATARTAAGGTTNQPTEVIMFHGIGTASFPVDCVTTGRPEQPVMGSQMSKTCNSTQFIVTSNNGTSRSDLPANTLSSSRLDKPSCTASSFYFPGWTMHDFNYRLDSAVYPSQPPDYETSYWGFEVYVNQSTESINYSCSGWRVLAPTDNNSCGPWPWRMKPEDEYVKGIDVTYRYDVRSYRLTVKTTWSCADLDAAHPYDISFFWVFTAVILSLP
ncbi:hypothetical protein V8F06_013156 [Rhypophila decipiens]